MKNESLLAACLSRYAGYYNLKLFDFVSEFGSLSDLYEIWVWKIRGKKIPLPLLDDLYTSWSDEQLSQMAAAFGVYNITPILSIEEEYPRLLQKSLINLL